MSKERFAPEQLIEGLDGLLHKNDYAAAERFILDRLFEARASFDTRAELLLQNELMGLYRKLGRKNEALAAADGALETVRKMGITGSVGAATTYLNSATVKKAFGDPEGSLELFVKARKIYERELESRDPRLGGLYNNMGLTLVDLGRFSEANELYKAAISVMENAPHGELEIAVTYLNMASAAEAEHGLAEGDAIIQSYIETARRLLDGSSGKDGYYAFVCEKCASVFGYYGHFLYEKELKARAERIYENERS